MNEEERIPTKCKHGINLEGNREWKTRSDFERYCPKCEFGDDSQ